MVRDDDEPHFPVVLVLALLEESFLDNIWTQLIPSVASRATIRRATTNTEAKAHLSATSAPSAVLVLDSGIAQPFQGRPELLETIIAYTRRGGTVVLSGSFSSAFGCVSPESFFAQWGVPWARFNLHPPESVVRLNGRVTDLSLAGLDASFAVKGYCIKNVAPESVVYGPAPASSGDSTQAMVAYARVGKGFLGYTGDIQMRTSTTKAVLAMMHLSPLQLPADTRIPIVGVDVDANGTPRAVHGSRPPQKQNPAPPSVSRRPREAEVEARARARALVAKDKYAMGEKFKAEGNELFRTQDCLGAIDAYKKAVDVAGPHATYMSNIAAAYLKVGRYKEAGCCATEAVYGKPQMLKAHYRRGLACLGLGRVETAMREFEWCVEQNPHCAEAQARLEEAQRLRDSGEYIDVDEPYELPDPVEGRDDPEDGYTSDSPDFLHKGNDTPCRKYNHDGCPRGIGTCPLKHGPDVQSIRDELGRNVCLRFLLGVCTLDDACPYAHSDMYLQAYDHKWWNNATKCEFARQLLESKNDVLDERLGSMLNETMLWDWKDVEGEGNDRTRHK